MMRASYRSRVRASPALPMRHRVAGSVINAPLQCQAQRHHQGRRGVPSPHPPQFPGGHQPRSQLQAHHTPGLESRRDRRPPFLARESERRRLATSGARPCEIRPEWPARRAGALLNSWSAATRSGGPLPRIAKCQGRSLSRDPARAIPSTTWSAPFQRQSVQSPEPGQYPVPAPVLSVSRPVAPDRDDTGPSRYRTE